MIVNMKIYIAHFIDYNFKEKEFTIKSFYYNSLAYLCMFIVETFSHIGFWIEDKEI